VTREREIKVLKGLKGENEKWAAATRELLRQNNVTMINLIGGPGCGKTALLCRLVEYLGGSSRVAVLEGDVETTYDARRIAETGIPVRQLLTGGACHLEARLVHAGLQELPLAELDFVFVENVGNLVCPAEFDIGERAKVAVISVTEGEDKPEKYPLVFQLAGAVILTKADLLPHVPFDTLSLEKHLRKVNPSVPLLITSALTGEGIREAADCFRGWRT